MISIYVLKTETEGVRYVGMTRNAHRRELQYRKHVKGHTKHLRNWLNKVGDALVFEVIETSPEDVADACERKWIAHYREAGAKLINYTDGGERGFIWTPDLLERMRVMGKERYARTGFMPRFIPNEEQRRAISERQRGKKCPRFAEMNKLRTGIPLSAEHKKNVAATKIGKRRSEASKALDRINGKKRWESPEIVAKMLEGCRRGGADPAGRIASAEKRRGVALTDEHRKKVSAGMKGKKHPGVAAYWARYRAAKAAEASSPEA